MIYSVTADDVMTGTGCQTRSRPAGRSQRSVDNTSVTNRYEPITDRWNSPETHGVGVVRYGPLRSPVRSAEDPPSQSGGQRTCALVLSPGTDAGRRESRPASPPVGSSELFGSCRVLGDPRLLSAPPSSPASVGSSVVLGDPRLLSAPRWFSASVGSSVILGSCRLFRARFGCCENSHGHRYRHVCLWCELLTH